MPNSPLTFCVSAYKNLDYLKLALHSVRTYSYYKDAPIIVFGENDCKDEIFDWLYTEGSGLYRTVEHAFPDGESNFWCEYKIHTGLYGIGGGMNITAKQVRTEYIMFLHADFFVSKNWDIEAIKVIEKYPREDRVWVFSQRFQPNIFNEEDRPGTMMVNFEDFGFSFRDFKEKKFIEAAEEFTKQNPNIEFEKGEGVSGLIRKRDWNFLGGNDERYAPAYWEDTDIFLRCQLANYKIILTTNSVVFHFGSRSGSSNFPRDNLKRSDVSKIYEQHSAKEFFDKWGFWPVHNQHQFVTIPPNIDRTKLQHLIRL